MALDCHKAVAIPHGIIVRFPRPFMRLFLLDKSPKFVALNIPARNVDDQPALVLSSF